MTEDTPLVMIVDDDAELRRSVTRTLLVTRARVVEAASAEAFFAGYPFALASAPQCLILDVRMAGMDGLSAQALLRQRGIHVSVVIVTGVGDIAMAVRAVRAGAADFLEKPFCRQRLLQAVDTAFAEDVPRRTLRMLSESVHARSELLTSREREVMELMAAGRSTKAIAHTFSISNQTAAKHAARVLVKMNVANATVLSQQITALREARTASFAYSWPNRGASA